MFILKKKYLLSQDRFDENSLKHGDHEDPDEMYKNAFYSDFQRILFSSSFRRLQDKAQVYPLEPFDYARTRLTHTHEVASIASAISNIILKKMSQKCSFSKKITEENSNMDINEKELFWKNNSYSKDALDKLHLDLSLCLQCASLLHDIGNPPFGHFGEEVINTYFRKIFFLNFDNKSFRTSDEGLTGAKKIIFNALNKDFQMKNDLIYFDGNAQSFRIATKLVPFSSKDYSMNLTAAVLGALIKYPFSSISSSSNNSHCGYFASENDRISDLLELNKKHGVSSEEEWLVFQNGKRNPLALIMEAADDICYSISDFEDSIQKDTLKYEDLCYIEKHINEFVENDQEKDICSQFIKKIFNYYGQNIENNIIEPLKSTSLRVIAEVREQMQRECADSFIENIESIMKGELQYTLIESCNSKGLFHFFRAIREKYMFPCRDIVIAELEGNKIITHILDMFLEAVLEGPDFDDFIKCRHKSKRNNSKILQLLSKNYVSLFEHSRKNSKDNRDNASEVYNRIRLVIDCVSGMTDTYAKNTYLYLLGIK